MARSTGVKANICKSATMTKPVLLIGHHHPGTIELASNFADQNGFRPCIEMDGRNFTRAYTDNPPTLILYEFFTDHFDGIELVRWLVDGENTARVVMTAASNLNVTGAAIAMAEQTDLFALTVLPSGASDETLLTALATG